MSRLRLDLFAHAASDPLGGAQEKKEDAADRLFYFSAVGFAADR